MAIGVDYDKAISDTVVAAAAGAAGAGSSYYSDAHDYRPLDELHVAGNVVALATTGTVAWDASLGTVATIVPSGDATINLTNVVAGKLYVLAVTTTGTTSRTLTLGTNVVSTGTLATGTVSAKKFTITFVGIGTELRELARTGAM